MRDQHLPLKGWHLLFWGFCQSWAPTTRRCSIRRGGACRENPPPFTASKPYSTNWVRLYSILAGKSLLWAKEFDIPKYFYPLHPSLKTTFFTALWSSALTSAFLRGSMTVESISALVNPSKGWLSRMHGISIAFRSLWNSSQCNIMQPCPLVPCLWTCKFARLDVTFFHRHVLLFMQLRISDFCLTTSRAKSCETSRCQTPELACWCDSVRTNSALP